MANSIAQSDIERRSFIRLPDTLPVKARFLDNRVLPFDATTRDISEGGVALNTNINKELLNQKDITLEIAIPSKNFSLNVKATIVWSTAKNNNINALGVKFIDIPELARNYLKNYILEKISPHVGNEEKPQEFLRKPDLELSEREKRNLSILDILRRRGSISKVEISQLVGLNIGTISNYVEEYIKKGIVFEKGLDVSSGGRRPNLLELNPDYSFSIGIDLSDRDYLKAVLTDFSGKVISKIKEERNNRWDNINQRLSDLVNELVDASKISFGKLRGIGLGVGSYANNYHPIKNFLEKTFGLAVLVENSCSASIFAERWHNQDLASIKNILYACLKEDNFGLILAGCLYSGSSGFVGKIALNGIRKTDSPDKKYCWMTEDCILRNQNNSLYENNNFKEMTSYFGIKIATAVNFLNPELVIIGGCSLKDKDGEVFLESIRNSVKRWAFEETIANVKIIPSQLDDMGVCLGVTALLTRELFTQI